MRGLDVKKDKGISGILENYVPEAPRKSVHALLAFVHRHQDPPFESCRCFTHLKLSQVELLLNKKQRQVTHEL